MTKLERSKSTIKSAMVRNSSWLDSWDDADELDRENLLETWIKKNASPYGGEVNMEILNSVDAENWEIAVIYVLETIDSLTEDDWYKRGLELGLLEFFPDGSDRIWRDALDAAENRVMEDVKKSFQSRDDVTKEDAPFPFLGE